MFGPKGMGVDIDNPTYDAFGNIVSGVTNLPLDRAIKKVRNVRASLDERNAAWQRIALLLGWNRWDLGVKSDKIELVKTIVKEKKKQKRKVKDKEKREEKKKLIEKENESVIEDNKEKSKKDGMCSAISKGGTRCKSKAVNGGFCTVHEKAEKRVDGQQTQCRKTKSDGNRCKMKTSNKSGYCYYHD